VARTVVCAIGKGCRSVVSGPRQMRGREKVAAPVWEANRNRLRVRRSA